MPRPDRERKRCCRDLHEARPPELDDLEHRAHAIPNRHGAGDDDPTRFFLPAVAVVLRRAFETTPSRARSNAAPRSTCRTEDTVALAALAALAAAGRTSEDRRHDADAPAEVAEASERVGARVAADVGRLERRAAVEREARVDSPQRAERGPRDLGAPRDDRYLSWW